jgi:hypothetical protein
MKNIAFEMEVDRENADYFHWRVTESPSIVKGKKKGVKAEWGTSVAPGL